LGYDVTNPEYTKTLEEYEKLWEQYKDKKESHAEIFMRYQRAYKSRESGLGSHVLSLHKDPVGATRKILRAMYNNTQDRFAKMGIKTIRIFRGYDPPGGVGAPPNETVVRLANNVLSSWSCNFRTAEQFGSVVLAIDVPVSRIIGSCQTGLGCLYEHEFILLGDNSSYDEAYVLYAKHRR
jgi:hypothetical protein